MLPQHRCSYVCPFCLVWWDDAEGAASCCLKAAEGKKKVRKRGTCPGKTLHRTKVKTPQIWKKQQQGAEPAPASPWGAGHPHLKSQSPEVLHALRAFLTSLQGGLLSENLSGAFFFLYFVQPYRERAFRYVPALFTAPDRAIANSSLC